MSDERQHKTNVLALTYAIMCFSAIASLLGTGIYIIRWTSNIFPLPVSMLILVAVILGWVVMILSLMPINMLSLMEIRQQLLRLVVTSYLPQAVLAGFLLHETFWGHPETTIYKLSTFFVVGSMASLIAAHRFLYKWHEKNIA